MQPVISEEERENYLETIAAKLAIDESRLEEMPEFSDYTRRRL
jgi:hypothetical protein